MMLLTGGLGSGAMNCTTSVCSCDAVADLRVDETVVVAPRPPVVHARHAAR